MMLPNSFHMEKYTKMPHDEGMGDKHWIGPANVSSTRQWEEEEDEEAGLPGRK